MVYFQEFEEAVQQSKDLKVLSETDVEMYSKGEDEKLCEVLCNLLDPFLECYFAVCNILLKVSTTALVTFLMLFYVFRTLGC